MIIFPAIDLYGGQAVRLTRGDYTAMTVYSDDPPAAARAFKDAGAQYLHTVDLEGARDGGTPNFATISALISSGLRVQTGGGIRSREAVKKYLDAGVFRVILGTAAVLDAELTRSLVRDYGGRIAAGVDIRDGRVAIKGWTELSGRDAFDFCREMRDIGIGTIISTDISKDGMLGGANLEMYREMQETLGINIVASGGVTTLDDVRALRDMGLYGAILGRALYTGALDLKEAIEVSGKNDFI